MERFELLLFDMDGTLIDTAADVVASEQCGLAACGLPPDRRPDEAWLRSRLGAPLDELLAEALGRQPAPRELDRFVEAYRAHHYGRGYPDSRVYPAVEATLATLARRHQLAVVTTRPTAAAHHLLDHFGLGGCFARVQGTEPHHPCKPDPTILQLVIAELGAAPARTLMIGDTGRDIAAGRAAGVRTVLVRHDRVAARPASPAADHVISDFGELLGIVGGAAVRATLRDPSVAG